jgi:TrmH family RNA methyltransferase
VTRPFISSSANARVKAARRLGRHRRRGPLLLVEGHRQLRRALDAGAAVHDVFAAPELFLGDLDAKLVARAERRGARVVELAPAAFRSLSGQVRPDGIAAVVERPRSSLSSLRLGPAPLLLVVEAVERPGNLGTIVRTASCAGADAVVVCDGRTDPFHPEAVRGSVGTIFHVPVVETSTREAVAWCVRRGLRVAVASPECERPYFEARLHGALALVVGSERHGVGSAWRAAAAESLAIPMAGPADSLNVAIAAGIVLFEAGRQRASGTDAIVDRASAS